MSRTDSRTCRPGLSLLKPKSKPVELWLAKISLYLFGLVSSDHDFKNIQEGLIQ